MNGQEQQGLGGFLAALRAMNSGYSGQFREGDVTVFGAYGMLLENWSEWSAEAGLVGADYRDPAAQDSVAGYWANKFHRRYGNWNLVSGAWFAGQDQADALARSGIDMFTNQRIAEFQQQIAAAQEQLINTRVPVAAEKWINYSPRGGWLNPIAGESEYSGGSWMPGTKNHRGRTHPAIDVYAERGTPIVAPVSGVIKRVGYNTLGGNTVTIQGDDGLTYYMAHMDEQSPVKKGQKISGGTFVGYVGNSGSARSTKPHLHLSIKKGSAYVNPKAFLDGSANPQGYFASAEGAAHVLENQQPSSVADHMLDTISRQVAGGDRLDVRELGNPEAEELADKVSMKEARQPKQEMV